jgi:type I restriction enzyme M protein
MTRQQTNETLRSDMWRACDLLRRDNNVGGIMQYTEHLAWLLFLRFLDEEDKRRADEAALRGDTYRPLLAGELAWDCWTALPANQIIQFVRGTLLDRLARLNGSPLARTVAGIFSDESVGDQTVTRNVPVCASG